MFGYADMDVEDFSKAQMRTAKPTEAAAVARGRTTAASPIRTSQECQAAERCQVIDIKTVKHRPAANNNEGSQHQADA